MKKILAALLASYALTSGQTPPAAPQAVPQAPATTAGAAIITSAAPQPPATTAKATTAAPLAPVAPATTTAKATTAAPAAPAGPTTTAMPLRNRYCPAGSGIGRQSGMGSQDQACTIHFGPAAIANDFQGKIRCNDFSCCNCMEINCGFQGWACETAQFGDSGAVGVKSINIQGGPDMWGFGGNNGAQLECNGLDSCRASAIKATYLFEAQCSGDWGCADADIQIFNPAPEMNLQCNGMMSCLNANIEITIGQAPPAGQVCSPNYIPQEIQLGTIEFNGQQAAQGATIRVKNVGCDYVIIRNFECMNPTACMHTKFFIEGNVAIDNCDLQHVQNLNNLPAALQHCMVGNQAPVFFPPFNPVGPFTPPGQVTPIVPVTPPVNPTPVVPINPPVNPPVNPTPVNPTPVNPTPAVPLLPPGSHSQLNCNGAFFPGSMRGCANQPFTIQPSQGFTLDCSSIPGVCAGMQLTLDVGMDPLTFMPVSEIDSLKFSSPNAAAGTVIKINNAMMRSFGGQHVTINDVRCETATACNGLTIIADLGVDIWSTNFDCQQPNSCVNCWIIQGNQRQPCDSNQMPIMFPGQGGPFVPQQQGPFAPAPQQPWI